MAEFTLQNDTLRLTFDRATGALVGLAAVQTGWEIVSRPHLGLSFRLLVPLTSDDPVDVAFAERMGRAYGERRNNPVYGEKQKLTALELAPDGKAATFTWDGVTSEVGGLPPAGGAAADQDHTDGNADRAASNLRDDRREPFAPRDRERLLPLPGGRPASAGGGVVQDLLLPVRHGAGVAAVADLHQHARLLWRGLPDPTEQLRPCGRRADGAVHPPAREKQGLYAGVCSPSSELVAWNTELRPGYGSSIDHRVPEGQSIGGTDVATRFAVIHVPYIQPGETRALTPIALEAYQGGWQQGTDIYKAWRDTWMKHAPQPAWAREPHSWLQLHINSPEDELRLPFRDLPTVAEQCTRHGIRAIQLVGWNDGGQDQGNPSHDPDPRLGTFEELREAIARCHALGVRIVLFAKFTWSEPCHQALPG